MAEPDRTVQSLKVGAAAQFLPVIAGYGTVLVTTPYVVSVLGLHNFGVWSLTGALAQYAALMDLGVSRSASRFVALFHAKNDRDGERAVVGICVAALTVLAVLLIGLTLSIPTLIDRVVGTNNPQLARFLVLCAVLIMTFGLLARVFAAASVGRGRQVPVGVGMAALSTLQAVGGVVALSVNPTLIAFATGTVAGTFFGLVVVVGVVLFDEHTLTIGLPSVDLTKQILGYGVQSQIAAAGGILLLQSGKLIAGILIGPAAAGVYELASRLAMGAQVLGAASAAAITPHLTRSFASGGMASVLAQYEHLTRRNTAVAILVPFAMIATAFTGIPLWLDTDDPQITWVLIALLPGIATNVSTGVCTSLLAAVGRPVVLAQAAVATGLLQAAFATASGYLFGFTGIAVAFAIGVPLANILSIGFMQAKVQIPVSLFFRGVRGPFVIGAIAMVAVLPIGFLTAPTSRSSALWPFLGSGTLFCFMYVALGWHFNLLPRVDLRSRIGRRGRGRHRS